ncbi:MAG TPA: AAA family ATPase [Gaiellaceae bacterium]|nr:AAA family ATPase [Gaiellaceae bacterium]
MLVGRSDELRLIEGVLADAGCGVPVSLVFRGEPGIGKTVLLEEARRLALSAEMRCVVLRCVESESALPGAGLVSLRAGLSEGVGTLVEPFRSALAGLTSDSPEGADRLTLAAAVLQALAGEAASSPLLLLVDDAHWLDEVSATALAFALRRVTDDTLAVITAIRPGYPSAFLSAGLRVIELEGMDPGSATELARRHDPSISAAVARELAEATGGNPMWMLDVARGLTAAQKAGDQPLGVPPPPAEGLHQAQVERIRSLSPAGRRAALIVASGEGADTNEVGQALAEAGLDTEELEADGVVRLEGRGWRFDHPLLRSAAYHEGTPADRRSAHALLVSACRDPVRAASHLAQAAAGPDVQIASKLEEAAVLIRARLGPGPAAAAFEQAAALTPRGREPDRNRRLGEAAIDCYASGRFDETRRVLDEALSDERRADLPPSLRGHLTRIWTMLEYWNGHPTEAIRLATDEADALAPIEPSAAFEVLMTAAFLNCTQGETAAAMTTAERLVGLAASPRQELIAALTIDHMKVVAGLGASDASTPEWRNRMVAEGPGPDLSYMELAQLVVPGIWCGELESAREHTLAIETAMRNKGELGGLPYLLGGEADLAWRMGRLRTAEALALQSEELGSALDDLVGPLLAFVTLSKLDALRGEEASSRVWLGRVEEPARGLRLLSILVFVEHAAGLLALTLGRPAEAVERFRAAGEVADSAGFGSPGFVPWQPDLAEALARSGAAEQAGGEADALMATAERCGLAQAEAAAWRVRGMLADECDAEACFVKALELHANNGPAPFEEARTLLCYGERLRRSRRRSDARVPLRRAVELFDELPAPVWGNRARVELAATGETRNGPPTAAGIGLTSQELQVAHLLCQEGATVREAAAKLFLSPKTVEVHLSRVYRKLAVSDRDGLRSKMRPLSGVVE